MHLIISAVLQTLHDCLMTDPLCVSQVSGDARRPPERGPGHLLFHVRVVSTSKTLKP